jgi:hypothetical protein
MISRGSETAAARPWLACVPGCGPGHLDPDCPVHGPSTRAPSIQEAVDFGGCETCGAATGVHCPPNPFGRGDIHLARWHAANEAVQRRYAEIRARDDCPVRVRGMTASDIPAEAVTAAEQFMMRRFPKWQTEDKTGFSWSVFLEALEAAAPVIAAQAAAAERERVLRILEDLGDNLRSDISAASYDVIGGTP